MVITRVREFVMLSLTLQGHHPQLLHSSVSLRSSGEDKGKAFLKVTASLIAVSGVVHLGSCPAPELLAGEGAVQLQGLQGPAQP